MSRRFFARSIEIPVEPERVWSVLADVERWPEWTASITRISPLTAGPLRVGSCVRIHQPKLPPAHWRVVEFRPGQGFAWESTGPGLRVTARHEVAPLPSGSRVMLDLNYEGCLGGWLARWTRHLNMRYLNLEAEGLKARCLEQATSSNLLQTP